MDRRGQQAKWGFVVSLWFASLLLVASIATALDVGEAAPDFTLPSSMGEPISLRQFRGKKLVLIEFHINNFGGT